MTRSCKFQLVPKDLAVKVLEQIHLFFLLAEYEEEKRKNKDSITSGWGVMFSVVNPRRTPKMAEPHYRLYCYINCVTVLEYFPALH